MRLFNFAVLMLSEFVFAPVSLGRKADRYLSAKNFTLFEKISIEKFFRRISSSSPEVARLEELRLYAAAAERVSRLSSIHPIRVWEKYRLEKQRQLLECHVAESQEIARDSGEVRVLHYFTNSLPYTRSGYTERAVRVVDSQRNSGIEVFAATRYNYPLSIGVLNFSQSDSINGIEFYRIVSRLISFSPNKQKRIAIRQLTDLCLELDIDVLQTTTGFENAEIVSLAAADLGIPWIYEVRGELEETWVSKQAREDRYLAQESDYYRSARKNEEKAMRMAARVIALSEVSKEGLVERGIEGRKIKVIPNGIDNALLGRDFTKAAARKRLGLERDKVYVGSITSVVGYEGLDVLIRALKFLPANVYGVVVGDGEALPSIKSLSESLGLTNRVVFPGRKPREEALAWYEALDVFTVPRRDTAVCRRVTPIKATNAQALGLPVVVSDLPALREVTGGYAIFVKPEDPKALAEGILSALEGDAPIAPVDWLESRSWRANGERYSEILRRSEN